MQLHTINCHGGGGPQSFSMDLAMNIRNDHMCLYGGRPEVDNLTLTTCTRNRKIVEDRTSWIYHEKVKSAKIDSLRVRF